MPTSRWSRRCALLLASVVTPLICGAAAGATTQPAISAGDDVAGPALAVAPAVRLAPPTTTTKSTTTTSASSTTAPSSTTPTTTTFAPTIVFPMNPVPYCLALDNYGDPRSGGRTHQGTDIMGYYKWTADQIPNQEVYAVVDGTLGNQKIDGTSDAVLSGNSWRLYSATGPEYYMYAHLSRFADGLTNGSVVKQGQVIGYVGDTGDPGEGNYHLHFEVHPTGTSTYVVNPMPYLKPVMPASCLS